MQEFERKMMEQIGVSTDTGDVATRAAIEELAAPAEQTKFCPKCKTLKKHSDFYPDKAQKSGLQTQCKKCKAAYNKEYQNKRRTSTPPLGISPKAERIPADSVPPTWSDQQLVAELRARGYDVTARKTTIIEL